ncbi:MAG: ABC transporter permease [Geobacter sp.]|nr:ABC transporter permease [Geobacter sp.]
MNSAKLVVRNITRRRGRFIFTLAGIAIGIASFVTFLSLGGSLKNEIKREATALGANLVVIPKSACVYEQVSILTGEQLAATITMEEVAKIRAINGLAAVPCLTEKTAINNRPVPVMGVLPADMQRFKGWEIGAGSYFGSPDEPGAVIGAVTARQFGLQPGSTVTVRGERLPVKGVLKESGGKDDLTIFLPLAVAQKLFKSGNLVSFVAVKVDDLAKVDGYITKIKETVSLGVVSDQQMLKSVLSIVGTVNVTLQLIAAVSVLAAAFGIINTMLTATYERKREIGILQALGARNSTIFTLFLMESAGYGVLGGIAGVVGGLMFSAFAAPYIGQNAFTAFVKGSDVAGIFDVKVMAGSILFSAIVAILAGVYPAWRAARLSPVEAISYE